jgi:hypothetical protein
LNSTNALYQNVALKPYPLKGKENPKIEHKTACDQDQNIVALLGQPPPTRGDGYG